MIQTITTKIPNRHGLNIAVLVEIPGNPKGLMFIVHGFLSHSQKISSTAMAETVLAHNLKAALPINSNCFSMLGARIKRNSTFLKTCRMAFIRLNKLLLIRCA
jgi:hypothetical protein